MATRPLLERIRRLADSEGIDTLGFADASAFADYAIRGSRRRDPALALPDAATIIVAGVYIGGLTLPAWNDPWFARTSRLYLSGFWLDVAKPLAPIADLLRSEGHQAVVCDESRAEGSVLPLKLAAVRAGLGWQGKHSLLISRTYGTFLGLGGVITDARLERDDHSEPDRCGTCDRCQRACPMSALDQPYVLDRSRCLSSLLQTEELTEQARAALQNRVADCEICQDACPWNKKHLANPLVTGTTESFKAAIGDWEAFFHLPDLVELSEAEYRDRLGGLNTNIPYEVFRRNARAAIENARAGGTPVQ